MGLDLFKLHKLRITAFKTVDRSGPPVGDKVFDAMYNPTSYSQTYALVYAKNSSTQQTYLREAPSELNLKLVLDGTGVEEMGLLALTRDSVSDRIQQFLAVTYNYDGAIHEPNYLVVEWGDLSFSCRLASVTITHNAFDRDGKPLRSELSVRFLSDKAAKQDAKEKKKSSPDLTHTRVVRHGDTLPLLTRSIYGSSARYLDVARFNNLDDFRRLAPGQKLLFPPLAALGDKEGAK